MKRKYAVNIADAARKLGCHTNVIYLRSLAVVKSINH